MITEYKLYSVRCDLCDKEYPGDFPDPCIYFSSAEEAEDTIKADGWVVMHNIKRSYPRILCPGCNQEAEQVMNGNYGKITSISVGAEPQMDS